MKLRENIKVLPPYPAGKAKDGFLKLSSNENPGGTSPKALKAITEHVHQLSVYQDGRSKNLSEALAKKFDLGWENIILGNGSDEIFGLIANAYQGPGRGAISAAHTFSEYRFSSIVSGGTFETVPMIDGQFDMEGILEAVRDDTSLIWLCSPNNPTGRIIPYEALEAFMGKLNSEILVVLDQAYADYMEAEFPSPSQLLAKYPNMIITRTFSKLYGLASLRIGFGMASKEIVSDLLRVKQPFNVNRLGQEAALAALEDEGFVQKSVSTNSREKKRVQEFLKTNGIEFYPTEGNFHCIRVPGTAAQAFDFIKEKGVLIRDLASFGLPHWIRVTIGEPDQNDRFLDALAAYIDSKK